MPKKPQNPHRLSILRSLTPHAKQGAFAELVGISAATLQSLELGRRPFTPELAKRVSLATGVHMDWLLGKSDHCTLLWGEPYDTGATITGEDLLDFRGLAQRLSDPADQVGQFVAGLLPADTMAAVSGYFRNDRQPVRFSGKNLLGVTEVARRLRRPEDSDPLGKYLRDELPPSTRALLEKVSSGKVAEKLRQALAKDLERVLRRGPLYETKRFEGMILSKTLKHELLGRPTGEELVRLNLKLLCEAFPGAIWLGAGQDPGTLADDLAHGLATIIAGDVVHDPRIFARVALRPVTKKLLASKPTGEFHARLNRLLLEDAFPDLVTREHGTGFEKWRKLSSPSKDISGPSLPAGTKPPASDLVWASAISSKLAFRIEVLLLASARPGSENSLAVQQRLLDALHDIASGSGLEDHIHAVLRELGAAPGNCHPLDASVLDQDETWEWLFYGPAPGRTGKINPIHADMAKQHEERLRKRFKHYRPA